MSAAKRVLIYTRVSRDDTGEGKSNARQEEDCRTLAQLRGWEVVEVVDDVSYSAYTGKKRPGWDRVVEAMRSGEIDLVLAWAMDRVTRTVRELTDIVQLGRETGVGIATVHGDYDLSSDTGKLLATLLSAVAEHEVERKGARQRLANRQRAAEGKPWTSGWRAFGFELDGTLIPAEADLIREAADKVLAGAPLRSIVREWKTLGISTPRSSKGVDGWTHNGVRSILLNPRNAGLNTYKGEVIGKGAWEPILSPETHVLLVAKLTDPGRLTRKDSRGRKPSNLLTGIARCTVCKEPVTAGTGYKSRLIYECKSYHVSTPRDDADYIVREAFVRAVRLSRPGLLLPMPDRGVPTQLWAELTAVQDRMNTVAESFAAGVLNAEQMETASTSLQTQRSMVEQQIAEAGANLGIPTSQDQVEQFEALDLNGQRAVLSRLAVIELHPRGRGRRNVPITHQVTVQLRAVRRAKRGKSALSFVKDEDRATDAEYLFTALDELPRELRHAASHEGAAS